LRALPRDLKRHPVAWLLARSSAPRRDADYLFGQLEKDGAARVTLAPLGEDAVAAMLTDVFGAPPDQALADLARGALRGPRAYPGNCGAAMSSSSGRLLSTSWFSRPSDSRRAAPKAARILSASAGVPASSENDP
jgi:hypothetical protein